MLPTVVGRKCPPKRRRLPNCKYLENVMWQKGLCRCDSVKDTEIMDYRGGSTDITRSLTGGRLGIRVKWGYEQRNAGIAICYSSHDKLIYNIPVNLKM